MERARLEVEKLNVKKAKLESEWNVQLEVEKVKEQLEKEREEEKVSLEKEWKVKLAAQCISLKAQHEASMEARLEQLSAESRTELQQRVEGLERALALAGETREEALKAGKAAAEQAALVAIAEAMRRADELHEREKAAAIEAAVQQAVEGQVAAWEAVGLPLPTTQLTNSKETSGGTAMREAALREELEVLRAELAETRRQQAKAVEAAEDQLGRVRIPLLRLARRCALRRTRCRSRPCPTSALHACFDMRVLPLTIFETTDLMSLVCNRMLRQL